MHSKCSPESTRLGSTAFTVPETEAKTGADTNGNDILPDKNYPSMYYSSLVGLQYKINKRFDVGLRYGRSLKKLYSVLWVDEFNAAMGHSNLHTSYLQLSLRVRL